jgi:hypothetical protein
VGLFGGGGWRLIRDWGLFGAGVRVSGDTMTGGPRI